MALDIAKWVNQAVASTPVYDLHTHLYPASFGKFCLWGVEELLTYHYLIAEALRASNVSYQDFGAMPQAGQADFIWKTLFIEHAPLSEACRGVLTVMHRLGADVSTRKLETFREFFRGRQPQRQVDYILKLANVRTVVMTNDALDPAERELWLGGVERDPRFKAVLRIDPLLLGWPEVGGTLSSFGYGDSMKEIRRFLTEWIDRMGAIYVAVSLPPTWRYPDDSQTTRVIDEAIVPVCREKNLPFAMMIGVTRQVNPQLKAAGDSLAKADVASLERLCAAYPLNKFMVTMLSRENQHELAVTARKFRNLFLFGCWWFLNNPSIIEEITRMRMELLGESFTPQHSDCRILEQLLYKWDHSRKIIAKVMADKFTDLAATGWPVSESEIQRSAANYLGGNFERFLALTPS